MPDPLLPGGPGPAPLTRTHVTANPLTGELPLILPVEDEPLILQASAELLESEDFSVIQAASAIEAIYHLDEGGRTVALMVDLDLKADLTGFDVAREARRRNAQIAVLYTSGSEGEGLNKQGVPNARFVANLYRNARYRTSCAR